jgi:lipoprotein NlpD
MSIFRNLHILLLLLLPLSLQACKKDKDYSPEKFYDQLKAKQAAKYYQVKAGDTLISISAKHGCHYQDIARWNNIEIPYEIVIGQSLKLFEDTPKPLPKTLSPPPLISPASPQVPFVKENLQAVTFVNYIVKKGDTLYSISRRFGVNSHLIATTNNLSALNQVNVGQKLKIPNTKQKHSTLNSADNQLIITKNLRFTPQKTSIISNNNENMLKFYCQWPINGKILKSFTKTGHRGIEISGYTGQKVRAVATGIVVAVNASIYGHGKFVVIKHNNNYMSSYANNQRTLVKRGQMVKQGQVIAELGKIGYKSPLLKFEIRKTGKLINPMYFLPKR